MNMEHVICPNVTDLEEDCKRNIRCPVAGCGKILPQKQSLRFHIVKVHGIIKDDTDLSIAKHVKLSQTSRGAAVKFVCPARDCQYAENGSKHFASNKLLKQHYMKMHAPKRYSCIVCSASFGLYRDLTRHEKACQRRVLCATCHVVFSTWDDLKSHCQLTQHEEPNIHIEVPCEKVGETNEMQANNDGDVAICVNSEHGTGVNLEQLQVKDPSTEDINDTASSASQDTDQHCNSSETEATDISSVSVNGQRSSSAVVNNHGRSCERCSMQTLPSVSTGVSQSCKSTRSDSGTVTVGATRVGKSSSTAVRQAPAELLPKPMYTLLPISSLLVVVNGGAAQLSGDCTRLAAIAPRPANVISGGNTCLPAVSQHDSSVVAGCHDGGDVLLQRKQQKTVASVVAQTSALPVQPRCQTAAVATQTSEQYAQASRLTKESRASQVSSKVRRKRPRDVQHSHTQTHGTNKKLRRITSTQSLGAVTPSVGTDTAQWWLPDMTSQTAVLPDVASNATQTVSHRTKLESIRTQTVESFLSSSQQEDLLDIASKLLSDSVASSRESVSAFSDVDNSNVITSSESLILSIETSKPVTSSNGGDGLLEPDVMLRDLSRQVMNEHSSSSDVTLTVQPPDSAASVFGVNCIGSQTLAPFVDELMNAIEDDTHVTGTPSSNQLSRVMLTSASQTMPDFDVVSTQTMDCDFDCDLDDFDDFIHTETQTTDMLANYFNFADIETQTASDMQYWDSETQTCFDALLSPSKM